ncbi:MAG TPA: hypothetical protein VFL13_13810 [Candidatus Baltobacteraceae bacterium]|nr:hypothetical protein [Candidatus Baltobacteraceae bacterium]
MKRYLLLAVATAAALAAVVFCRPHATPGPPMRDFEAYYAAGSAVNAGADPYGTAIWRFEKPIDPSGKPFALLPFVSPPSVLPAFRAIALLPFGAANVLWRILLAACIAVLALGAFRLCGVAPDGATVLCAGCLAIGFGPLTSALALGQLALPAMAAATAAFLWPPAAVAAWIQPNLALVLFSRPPRAIAIWTIVGALLLGLALTPPYAFMLLEHGFSERFSAIQFTPDAIAYGAGASAQTAVIVSAVAALAAFAAWFLAMRRLEAPFARFAAGCALLPFGMPFFHEHDFIVAFVPAVAALLLCKRRLWWLAAAGAGLCSVDWLGIAQRSDGTLQSVLLCAAFLLAAAWIRSDVERRQLLYAAGILGAFFAGAYALALGHPLPVWPDAMHALAATSFDTAAQAWRAEQDATGLFMQQPAWSALRALPPAGCIVLVGLFLARQIDVHEIVERRNRVGMEVA